MIKAKDVFMFKSAAHNTARLQADKIIVVLRKKHGLSVISAEQFRNRLTERSES